MAKNDRINQQILQELTRDGRISNLELAERVGLSPSACLRRVQDLEQAGVITGYRAVLDRDAMGRDLSPISALALESIPKRPNRPLNGR